MNHTGYPPDKRKELGILMPDHTSRCILQLVQRKTGGSVTRIAVATIDGVSLSQHFGQSKGFVVFEVDGTKIISSEVRTNQDTPHKEGICNHGDHQTPGASGHPGILGLLKDCTVVLCGGMGAGAAQSLLANGLKPVIVPGTCSAQEAAAAYVRGDAPAASAGFCNCQH
jgi:predicted Fe-Mo cluster-binding NifX family protein